MATKIKSAMTNSGMTTKVEVKDLTPKDPVKVKGGVKLTDILVSSYQQISGRRHRGGERRRQHAEWEYGHVRRCCDQQVLVAVALTLTPLSSASTGPAGGGRSSA